VSASPHSVYRWIYRPTLVVAGIRLPSYAVMLYLGCVAGVLAGSAAAEAWGAPGGRVATVAITLTATALVGSRSLYIATHFDLFRAQPSRLWQRLDGGGSVYGGLLLAIALSPALLFAADLGFLAFWDAASVIMLLGLAITKVGCLMRGCCAGRPTNLFLGQWLPDHTGTWQRRFPSQLLESGWAILVLAAVYAVRMAWPASGVVFGCTIALYGAGRVALENTRLPDGSRWSRTVNVAISTVLALAGTALLVTLA
jgi:phosphatidylglycerol:prolipoprotein diacylglycerol transferase